MWIRQARINSQDVETLEQVVAHFTTKLACVDPADEELFQETINILSYELKKLLASTNCSITDGLLEFFEKTEWHHNEKE